MGDLFRMSTDLTVSIQVHQRVGRELLPAEVSNQEGSELSVKIFYVSGCEVYVTRIPRDCFEQELLPVFSRAGEIYEMRLMMDHNGLNRGYAYVKFTNTQVREREAGVD